MQGYHADLRRAGQSARSSVTMLMTSKAAPALCSVAKR